MFEVTLSRLEAIATAQIAIASALVASETTKAVMTFGATSATAVLANIALTTAQVALATEIGAEAAIAASTATMLGAMASIGGAHATSAGSNAALIAAIGATA